MLLQVPQVLHDRCGQKNGFKRFFYPPCVQRSPRSTLVQGWRSGQTSYSPIPWQVSQFSSFRRSRDAPSRSCSKLLGEEVQNAPVFGTNVVGGKAGPSDPPIKPPQCQERLESSMGASQWSGYWLPKILHPSIPPPSPWTENHSGKGLSLPYCSTFIEQRSPPA